MARTPSPDDDSALRWDDVDDPTYAESDVAYGSTAGAADDDGADPLGGRESPEGELEPEFGAERRRTSVAATLLTGIFAVIYLAYSVGWIISIGLVPLTGPILVIEIMYQFSEFLALLASALWFAAVVALTRGGRSVHRVGWLALGTLVLVPWPIVLGVLS